MNSCRGRIFCGSPVLLIVGAPRMFLLVCSFTMMLRSPWVLGCPLASILMIRVANHIILKKRATHRLHMKLLCCLAEFAWDHHTCSSMLPAVVVVLVIAVVLPVVPVTVGWIVIPVSENKSMRWFIFFMCSTLPFHDICIWQQRRKYINPTRAHTYAPCCS